VGYVFVSEIESRKRGAVGGMNKEKGLMEQQIPH
jgi:hypothetical protein